MRDSGSFRDPSGFIYYENNKVFRVVNKIYAKNYEHLINSGLHDFLVKENYIVSHIKINKELINHKQYCILDTEKIEPIIYPYEWSFSQYKDAALLTLKIQKKSIEYGMTLKDASPYNIQFKNNNPIFIDTLSFEIINNDFSWKAYKQFCEMFLSPLCLMAFKDPTLIKLLFGNINGISLETTNKLLSLKNKFNFSVFLHLTLPNLISKINHKSASGNKDKKITKKQHLNIISQLENFITSLNIIKEKSEWGEYNIETVSEKKEYVIDKEETINEFIKNLRVKLSWDIGSNDGYYSRLIAKESSEKVYSFDIDWKCVERNYLINSKNNVENVYPILLDLTNPSPGIGWLNKERKGIFERIGSPNLICCLALMHHLINANIPLTNIIDLLKKTSEYVIVEYIPFIDPKCEIIFKTRDDSFQYPTKQEFEQYLQKHFIILNQKTLNQTQRELYLLKKNNL